MVFTWDLWKMICWPGKSFKVHKKEPLVDCEIEDFNNAY